MAAMDHCMRKWYFGYDQLLMSRAPAPALNIGTSAHLGIEMHYANPGMTAEEIVENVLIDYDTSHDEFVRQGGYPKDEDQKDDEKKLIASMVREYIKETQKLDHFEVKELEEKFDIPIINPYTREEHPELRLMGMADGRCLLNGHHFVMEHKTAAMAEGDWWWKYLNQLYTYGYALQRKHNIEITGAFVNVLIKKIPGKPKFKKDGGLSKQRYTATVESFTKAVEEAGKDISNFSREIAEIERRGNPFIIRKRIYFKQPEFEEIERKVWHAMQRKLNDTHYARSRSDLCNRMCSFKPICNIDSPELREDLYIKRKSRHAELEENGTD